MPIPIQQIRDIVNYIFSPNGYNIKNLNVSFPEPLDIKVVRDKDDNIVLSFTGSLPKVGWQKIIRLTAWVQGITLGQSEGVLRLKYLPDIKFGYDTSSENIFNSMYSTDDISNKCLQYASEWATIASQGGVIFSSCSEKSKRQLKRECKMFVMDNVRNDPEIVAGSVLLTFLFFYVVLPVILKFVLERLFKKLFN